MSSRLLCCLKLSESSFLACNTDLSSCPLCKSWLFTFCYFVFFHSLPTIGTPQKYNVLFKIDRQTCHDVLFKIDRHTCHDVLFKIDGHTCHDVLFKIDGHACHDVTCCNCLRLMGTLVMMCCLRLTGTLVIMVCLRLTGSYACCRLTDILATMCCSRLTDTLAIMCCLRLKGMLLTIGYWQLGQTTAKPISIVSVENKHVFVRIRKYLFVYLFACWALNIKHYSSDIN